MEKLKYKRENFIKTLQALEKSNSVFFRKDIPEDIQQSLVASNIKHFEMCYEATCKYLQAYLFYKFDKQLVSAKPIFRECFSLGLIDSKTTKELLDICEARNASVHEYDEESALETSKRMSSYFMTLKCLEQISL